MEDELYAIGVVTGARGLKGEIKVKPLTDYPDRFNHLKSIILYKSEPHVTYDIQRVRFHKNLVILQLKGVETRTDAEKLAGFELLIRKEELIELENDEYFWFDLIGMEVSTTDNVIIGTIKKILDGPANDIYVIENDGTEHLIPAVKQVIVHVDIKNKKMVIDPMPGLISDEDI
jgi:16S rRNA processing protein RimM